MNTKKIQHEEFSEWQLLETKFVHKNTLNLFPKKHEGNLNILNDESTNNVQDFILKFYKHALEYLKLCKAYFGRELL